MKTKTKVLISTIGVGVLGSLAAFGIFGLFSATTQNAGNEISTGTVALSDNDGGSALFNVTGASPGDSWTKCIKVSYNGTLASQVHVYLERTPGPLEDYLNLTMVQGSQASSTFPDCTGFVNDGSGPGGNGTIFVGPMTAADGSYDLGLPLFPAGQTSWNPGDTQVYKMTMTLDPSAPDDVQGASTGTASIIWEARNDA